jgi:DNA invertase Pin-like site-specific DNA recombinase
MDRQNESSIGDQVRVCTEYARRQGWEIAARYEDQGISGAAQGNRPGFLRMRADAMGRKFDVLLVIDTTRLARSHDLAPLIERLRFQGIRVIGVQDSFDSSAGTADMQAGLSGLMSVEFRKMIRARTHAALESRARAGRSAGGKAYAYREGKVVPAEAAVVREIFSKFASGMPARAIAAELNAKGIPSPGSTWNRTQRRASGWLGSGIRVILRNERYRGVVHWNQSEWRKDPDTGKRQRITRPQSEWISHTDESLRIVSDKLWQAAQHRIRTIAHDGNWAAPKGKPKYLLSGLLRCATCGAHYVIVNRHEYSCSSYVNGRACSNGTRVRRLDLQQQILGPVDEGLLAPDRVDRMAKEMQAYYAERVRAMQTRATEVPRELQELNARLERLRERLKKGDPDMTADEIQAAIDRAEGKRRELQDQQPEAKESAKVLSIMPRAAAMYRKQIAEGLDGNPRAALKARVFLREYFNGRIDLEPGPNGELWASYGVQPAALLQVVGNRGSGGPLR